MTIKMSNSISELEELYNQTNSGHWFDPDTMRFFKSKLTGDYRRIDDKTALFISTEKPPHKGAVRMATVNIARITDKGKISINTCGDFCKSTLARARKDMKAWVSDE